MLIKQYSTFHYVSALRRGVPHYKQHLMYIHNRNYRTLQPRKLLLHIWLFSINKKGFQNMYKTVQLLKYEITINEMGFPR